jgi:hypothetical protein
MKMQNIKKKRNLSPILLKIVLFLIMGNSIVQLAISQIHISAITKMFKPSIGLYLFGFIIFGLVSFFNVSKVKVFMGKISTLLFCLLTSGFGIIFLSLALSDTKVDRASIQSSILLIAVSTVLYLAAAIMLAVSAIIKPNEDVINI